MGIAAVICVVAVGCGGNDDSKPEDAVRTYFEALADGDGQRACDQLTVGSRRAAVGLFEQRIAGSQSISCAEGMKALSKTFSDDEKTKLRDIEIARTETHGDTAEVKVKGAAQRAELEKNGDGWLISGGLFQETGNSTGESQSTEPDAGSSPSDGDQDRERSFNRLLRLLERDRYLDVAVSGPTATVRVRAGMSRDDADDFCGLALAVAPSGVNSIVIVSKSHGRERRLASC